MQISSAPHSNAFSIASVCRLAGHHPLPNIHRTSVPAGARTFKAASVNRDQMNGLVQGTATAIFTRFSILRCGGGRESPSRRDSYIIHPEHRRVHTAKVSSFTHGNRSIEGNVNIRQKSIRRSARRRIEVKSSSGVIPTDDSHAIQAINQKPRKGLLRHLDDRRVNIPDRTSVDIVVRQKQSWGIGGAPNGVKTPGPATG